MELCSMCEKRPATQPNPQGYGTGRLNDRVCKECERNYYWSDAWLFFQKTIFYIFIFLVLCQMVRG